MPNLLPDPKIILLPSWQHRALIRAKVDLNNYISYEDLTAALSKTDLSQLVCLNEIVTIDNYPVGNAEAISDMCSVNGTRPNPEYLYSIEPLSKMPSIVNELTSRLTASEEVRVDVKPFSFVTSPLYVIVIVEDGFLSYLKENSDIFLSDLMREMCRILSVTEVSGHRLFKSFIKLL